MEYIKEALTKAKASERLPVREHNDKPSVASSTRSAPTPSISRVSTIPAPTVSAGWSPPRVSLLTRHLEDQRIVSFAGEDPAHVAFDLLRTRVRRLLADQGWKSVAVTSPTPGCGKTMVALNLAFSLARAPDCRVVLLDFDLKKSAVGRSLGVQARGSIARYFEKTAPAEDCFLQVTNNLFVGINDRPLKHSAEMMQSPRMREFISAVSTSLAPDILLFDLPPMRGSDDALAFLPHVDAALLVIAAGKTTVQEVEDCERQISHMEKLLGVVLNKCEERAEAYYYA